jgi:hypothetical protein
MTSYTNARPGAGLLVMDRALGGRLGEPVDAAERRFEGFACVGTSAARVSAYSEGVQRGLRALRGFNTIARVDWIRSLKEV